MARLRVDNFVPHTMVKFINEEIRRRGLTQCTVARMTNGAVRSRALSDWSTRTNPSLTHAEAVLEALGFRLEIVPIEPNNGKPVEQPFRVFMVAYSAETRGYEAVAVSAQSRGQAMARVRELRVSGLEVLMCQEIPGRVPMARAIEIEGMCDLENRRRPPPERGSQASRVVRARNFETILKLWGPEEDGDASSFLPHGGSADLRATNQ